MKWLQWAIEIAGVGLLTVAAWWTFAPAGLAVVGGYLMYLTWDGGTHDDGD